MRVAICDDNVQDAEQVCTLLHEHFEKNGFLGEIQTFRMGEALLEAFHAHAFDVVFLDIYMDGMDGIKTAEKLRKIDPTFALVFITTSVDHALDSFSLGTLGYVVKPIKREDADRAFAKCRNVFLKNGRFQEVISNRMKLKVPLSKILYIETYGRETTFRTMDGEIKSTAPMPLEELEGSLGYPFLRCHRSYIVNLNHVETLQIDNFRMEDGSLVPLRQRGRGELRDAYGNFISNRLFEVSP